MNVPSSLIGQRAPVGARGPLASNVPSATGDERALFGARGPLTVNVPSTSIGTLAIYYEGLTDSVS